MMDTIDKSQAPSAANHYHVGHASLLVDSYHRVCGKHLLPHINIKELDDTPNSQLTVAKSLFEANFVVVSHGTEDDPIFNYTNQRAMGLFEMDWQAFVALPSRKSAEPLHRDARDTLMRTVREKGFIDNYAGIRISGNGRRFEISDAVVWNIIDAHDVLHGQAASFSQIKYL